MGFLCGFVFAGGLILSNIIGKKAVAQHRNYVGVASYLIGLVTMVCISVFIYLDMHESTPRERIIPINMIKTVAHLEMPEDEYSLVQTDTNIDVAYYVPTKETSIVQVGEKVYFWDGIEARVTEVTTDGFTLEKPENFVASGRSGTAVVSNTGIPVGVVSSLIGKDKIRCIYV